MEQGIRVVVILNFGGYLIRILGFFIRSLSCYFGLFGFLEGYGYVVGVCLVYVFGLVLSFVVFV